MRPQAIKATQYSDPLTPERRAWVRAQNAELIMLTDDCGSLHPTTYGALECAITSLFFSGASVIYANGQAIAVRYAAVKRMPDSKGLRRMVSAGHFSIDKQVAISGWTKLELRNLRKSIKGDNVWMR
jgi:hypothetical protein